MSKITYDDTDVFSRLKYLIALEKYFRELI